MAGLLFSQPIKLIWKRVHRIQNPISTATYAIYFDSKEEAEKFMKENNINKANWCIIEEDYMFDSNSGNLFNLEFIGSVQKSQN